MLQVSGDFAGANPPDNGIKQLADNRFILHAFSETPDESFRLDTRITNTGGQPQTVELEIIWPTAPFSELRDCFYWRRDNAPDWITVPASTEPGLSRISFDVEPGSGILSLHPYYDYADCEKFIASLNHPCLEKQVAGLTGKGRNLWLLKVGAVLKQTPEKKFLISARNHANESSGSYCVEGMLEWLLSDAPLAKCAMSRHEFYFVPMSNPDGVADGMARHTCPERLVDLNKTRAWHEQNAPGALPDKTFDAYYQILDTVQPTHFMNLHSYLFKFQDELYVLSSEDAERFFKFMPDQIEFNKVWKKRISDHSQFPTGYCHEKYGTLPLLPEIPWFGRNAAAMRLTGRRLLEAFIMMNTAGQANWSNI
jgi:hypothetical protein